MSSHRPSGHRTISDPDPERRFEETETEYGGDVTPEHTSTSLAHQLLHRAKADGRQVAMLDALFSALADEVDLEPADTRAALETARYAGAVRTDREPAAAYGVRKIPTYVMAGRPPIHGAKRPTFLLEALRRAAGNPPD